MFDAVISQPPLMELTSDIVSAYVANNNLPASELPAMIKAIYGALSGTEAPVAAVVEAKSPAVSIRKSITDDFLICLEDGRKFKSLKRHLRTKYDLSPEAYRAKWGLPTDYPMTAPAYSASRSAMAKSIGLGQGGRKPKAGTPAKAAAKRGRPAKTA